MRPLVISQEVMTWLGILPSDNLNSIWKKSVQIITSFVIIVTLIMTFAGSIAFISENTVDHLDKIIFAYCISFIAIRMLYIALVAYLVRHGIYKVFKDLEEIYDKSKNFNMKKIGK